MQPLFASSAYTVPFWLPTNTRPAATVGCDHATDASGNPNAHFNFNRGKSAGVRPACSAAWNRELVIDGLHPVQRELFAGSCSDERAVQRPADAPVTSPWIDFPVRNSATARRSAPLKRAPCGRIAPVMSASTMA